MTNFRLELAISEPRTVTERELLQMYRESLANDQTILYGQLMIWPSLSSGHRGIVYRVADALWSACQWRHHKPVPPEQEALPTTVLDAAARLLADDEER